MPNDRSSNVAPAHTLWVELSTRITTQRLHYRSGDEETAATSVYSLFSKTRALMEANPEAAAFLDLACHFLNTTLRPYTARWQGWMTPDSKSDVNDGPPAMKFRDDWVRRQFRRELRALQPRLVGYRKAFAALKDGQALEPWWIDPDAAQIEALRAECVSGLQARLGASLEAGICDQVRFAHTEEDQRRELCARINAAEQGEIRRRRGLAHDVPVVDAKAIAFSGGGIRSATFCLGITQVLARRGLLPQFDYLSTVSGGGYLGSFLSAYLGTGEREVPPSPAGRDESVQQRLAREHRDELADVQARIQRTFVPTSDLREPRALRHLRNRSRYLVDDGFLRKTLAIVMVAAGILFNLLIVLPIPLAASLLTVVVRKWQLLGAFDWIGDGGRWLPPKNAPASIALLAFLALVLLELLLYPMLKRRALTALRKHPTSRLLALWTKLFVGVAAGLLLTLSWWVVPLCFRLYHLVRSGAFIPWFGELKGSVDQWLAVFGVSLATLLGTLASRSKKTIGVSGLLKKLAIVSGPLLYLLVYLTVGYRMMFATDGDHWPARWVLLGTALMTAWAWWSVDVNTYSPHGYYRDRLSECYLQTRKKMPSPGGKVEFDLYHADRLRLSELNTGTAAPYHLVNTTVNLPSSDLREIRGRNGDFFVFSKHFCGSPMCGYYATRELEDADPHLDLGTAMAISGAAASSNMGWQTSNSLRLVMTLANVRLGYWLRSPRLGVKKTRAMTGPGPLYLLREMFALQMDEQRKYLNLSDGGHIENLAVYELLRRRCKFIVCVDGGMEPDMQCVDLMRLERYAAIDLGIKMHYDVSDLKRQANGHSRTYGVLVKIDYAPPKDESERQQRKPDQAPWGWMLYMKLATIGYGPGYVMDYQCREPGFPHQTTADQVFEEAQFEAYRALGEAAAETFFNQEIIDGHDAGKVEDWFAALASALLPDNDEAFRS